MVAEGPWFLPQQQICVESRISYPKLAELLRRCPAEGIEYQCRVPSDLVLSGASGNVAPPSRLHNVRQPRIVHFSDTLSIDSVQYPLQPRSGGGNLPYTINDDHFGSRYGVHEEAPFLLNREMSVWSLCAGIPTGTTPVRYRSVVLGRQCWTPYRHQRCSSPSMDTERGATHLPHALCQ